MNLREPLLTFLLAGGAVYLMMLAGLAKSALEPKRVPRVCPSCGRLTRDCRCGQKSSRAPEHAFRRLHRW